MDAYQVTEADLAAKTAGKRVRTSSSSRRTARGGFSTTAPRWWER